MARKTLEERLMEERLRREAEQLLRTGRMPTLEELCAAVLEARKKYANQIRRARREAESGTPGRGERGSGRLALRTTGRDLFRAPDRAAG